jgi:hypothetical protein
MAADERATPMGTGIRSLPLYRRSSAFIGGSSPEGVPAMMRQVCWNERLEDGVRREVRVAVQRGQVKWQFKRTDEEHWDYTTPPTRADWDALVERMEDRYQRRNVSHDDLELVRRERGKAAPVG